jgi:hypothetical protein
VPFQHRDDFALEVVSGLLNGQTGRLHKGLVLDRRIAAGASASQQAYKFNGLFALSAETRGEATPAELEAALVAELERLQNEPVPADELQKVKNQVIAGSYRNLQNPFFLLIQLLFYEGWGDWTYLNTWADRTVAVTADDVQRVARKYFTRENRTVATYQRKAGSEATAPPPELAGLPAPVRQGVMQQIEQIRSLDDAAALEGALASMAEQRSSAPPALAPAFDLLERTIRERLAGLDAPAAKEEGK